MSNETVYRLGLVVLALIVYGVMAVYAWHVISPPAYWWITRAQFATLRWWVIGYMCGIALGIAFALWRANNRP
jgi:hypothetical protein